ncbi:MAG TPA: glutamine--fructose-6-phosphate transaminase (isomerizing) [Armatimonadota bacterium]|jgi:glucosamine--fructose-6-phosphate aminotransferase (isomerizing)
MCGITGYVGSRSSTPLILEALKKLEYRGYDSAGIAVVDADGLEVTKSVGKIAELERIVHEERPLATTGIAHTRWATHGVPSTANAHPHTDASGRFAVVHNGIVENHRVLRARLEAEGVPFASQTDTEVIPQLIARYYEGDFLAAFRQALGELHGSYAVAAVCAMEPGKILVARKDSPLVIGPAPDGVYVASDIPAVLEHTRDVLVLEDGDVGVVTPSGVELTSLSGEPRERAPLHVTWDAESATKGGYEHFMRKEIHDQPATLRDAFRGRLTDDNRVDLSDELGLSAEAIRGYRRIVVVACGTAYHAGYVAKLFWETILRLPVEAQMASEFRYREPLLLEDALVVVVSQSGETADTLAALRAAREQGSTAVAVVNAVGSTIAREADHVLYTWAGPEICVASTKAYLTQLAVLYQLGLHLAAVRGTLPPDRLCHYVTELKRLPDLVQRVLEHENLVINLAQRLWNTQDFFYIGRGLDYAVAMEGALKLKEISYIHAEAYAAGELKHGPLALVAPQVPVVCLATQTALRDKMMSNIQEVSARNARTIGVVRASDLDTARIVDHVINVPDTDDAFMPILSIVPLQLLAYYIARELKREIDQPRNLAKSVTVE